MSLYEAARVNMVEGQVKPNRVTDEALLAAMLAVPRERFVPEALRGIAHVDEALPLGRGRFLVEPMITGRLLQEAEVTRGHRVLVVGAGTGYTAAVLARLGAQTVALEEDRILADQAREALADTATSGVMLVEGPLTSGWAASAPYDVIIVDGAVAAMPQPILEQIAEGGRLATIVASGGGPAARYGYGVGRGTVFSRVAGTIVQRPIFDASTPFLPGFEPKPTFEF